jgi:peptide-methionine (R)-S-oxide reductase
MTRREFLGMASVGAVAIAITARVALTAKSPEMPDETFPVQHSDAEWRALLPPAGYKILRQAGTEAPFSSPLLSEHRPGLFACLGCGQHLFDARTKYDSHTGWPSFWNVLPHAIVKRDDSSIGMSRTEVRCARCGGHLGHVFTDGPQPTGLRYCMNGAAMVFQPAAT